MGLDATIIATGYAFPLDWEGRIVTRDEPGMSGRLRQVLLAFGHAGDVRPGRRSRQGTYVTYEVHARIADRTGLQQLLHALAAVPGVMKIL